MTNSIPIVRKLQTDGIDQDISVSTLLRTAKIVATKLDLQDTLKWIDRELNGYMDQLAEELPPYRHLKGTLEGRNSDHDWQPIRFKNPEDEHAVSHVPVGTSIGTIEEGHKGTSKNAPFSGVVDLESG